MYELIEILGVTAMICFLCGMVALLTYWNAGGRHHGR